MEATRRLLGRSKSDGAGSASGSSDVPISGTQAKRLSDPSTAVVPTAGDASNGKAGSVMETKPSRPMAMRSSGRQQTELVVVLKKMHAQLEAQAEREKELTARSERLPEALAAAPQISRQITNLMEFMQDQAGRAAKRDDLLQQTISSATEQQKRQLDVLGLIEQQIESSNDVHGEVVVGLETLRQSIGSTNEHAEKVVGRLETIAGDLQRRERSLADQLLRTEQRLMMTTIGASVVAAGAMILAAVALFS
jgi:hypothetical protein